MGVLSHGIKLVLLFVYYLILKTYTELSTDIQVEWEDTPPLCKCVLRTRSTVFKVCKNGCYIALFPGLPPVHFFFLGGKAWVR